MFKYFLTILLGIGLLGCSDNEEPISKSSASLSEECNVSIQLIKDFGKTHSCPTLTKSTSSSDLIIKDVRSKVYYFEVEDSIVNRSPRLQRLSSNSDSLSVTLYTVEFEKNGNSGFAIASGDERISNVYAYTENGQLSDTLYNVGLKYTLANIENVCKDELIRYYNQPKKTATATPLLVQPFTNLEWNQTAPYNQLAKVCSSAGWAYAGRCPAGCTTIAVAQAVAWLLPPKVTGFYLESLRKIKSYPLGATTGDWVSNMANYIRYIGNCVNIEYSCEGSGALIKDIRDEFDTWGIHYSYAEDKNVDLDMLAYNLVKELPHITSGFTKKPRKGHSWIWEGIDCKLTGTTDGHSRLYLDYSVTPKLYCNWGWGGSSNGWYVSYEQPEGHDKPYLDDNCQLYITGTSFSRPAN